MRNTFILLLLISSLSSFGLNPSSKYNKKPSDLGLEYKEISVETLDGSANLTSWIIYPNTPSTKILLVSHNGEGNMSNYIERYKVFTQIGYTVVTYDYRGFGTSSLYEIDNNMFIYPRFLDDLKTMISYCSKINNGKSIDLYGWGIGAGMSVGVGWNTNSINKIIADTPFLSMEDLEERFSDWDEPLEVPFAGYDSKYEPINALNKTFAGMEKEILLIIGSNDILFNKSDMEKLRNKRASVNIKVINNPDRRSNFDADKVSYSIQLTQFLHK